MGVRRIIDIVNKLEEQRRLADPFYAKFHDRKHALEKRIKGRKRIASNKNTENLHRLEISIDALWFKCQETDYRFQRIQSLTKSIADRTFDTTIAITDGPKVRASFGIDSDSVAFEFDAFLQVAKSTCDKLAEVARVLMAVEKDLSEVQGLKSGSIHDFVKSVRKMQASTISTKIIVAWDSWIKDLNECRDYVEHHGRYFTYARNPYINFPITVPPPKYLKGLTRAQVDSLSIDDLPSGNIDLTVYCQQTLNKLQKLVLDIMD